MRRRSSNANDENVAANDCVRRPTPRTAITQIHEADSSCPSHERLHNTTESLFADDLSRVDRQDVHLVRELRPIPPALTSAPIRAPEPLAVAVTLCHVGLSSIPSPDSKSSELNARVGSSPTSGTWYETTYGNSL